LWERFPTATESRQHLKLKKRVAKDVAKLHQTQEISRNLGKYGRNRKSFDGLDRL
jgi:hypothetical protein